jgi:hypothetical protein
MGFVALWSGAGTGAQRVSAATPRYRCWLFGVYNWAGFDPIKKPRPRTQKGQRLGCILANFLLVSHCQNVIFVPSI